MKLGHARNRILPGTAIALICLLSVWLVLAPSETRLGQIIKLIYVHGALVWVGLGMFTLAGALGLVALIIRKPVFHRGTAAASLAAIIIWIVYVISSMAVTGLTWGQLIAWNEPRVQATALILGAALLLALVAKLVDQSSFTAAVSLVMGIVPWIIVRRAGAIRHPQDPIGGSGSVAMQDYYLLIMLTVGALALVLLAWLWVGAEITASTATLRGSKGNDE
jgi:hypothetical protein